MQPSHVDLLRQIRLFKHSDSVVVSKPGKTEQMGLGIGSDEGEERGEDWTSLREGVGMIVEMQA